MLPCSNLQRTVFFFITHLIQPVGQVTIFIFAPGQCLHGATPKTSRDMLPCSNIQRTVFFFIAHLIQPVEQVTIFIFAPGQCLHGATPKTSRDMFTFWDVLISRHRQNGDRQRNSCRLAILTILCDKTNVFCTIWSKYSKIYSKKVCYDFVQT